LLRRACLVAFLLAACGDDSSGVRDAAVDAADGARDARVACPALPCPDGMFCDIAICGGSGACKPTPTTCPLSFNPVCGCNHVTYQNDCQRKVAGVGLLNVGHCNEACPLTPRSNDCCFNDGDCASRLCAGELCDPGKEGRCVNQPGPGSCWFDYDCGDAGVCHGATMCPCGSSCVVADSPGTCGPP
jgi:hypothetical protein